MKRKKNNRSLILLLVLLLAVIVTFFLIPEQSSIGKEAGLSGDWKFYFTYSNDTSLVYRGDLQIEDKDSLVLNFQIKAPRSSRAEVIQASNVVKTANGIQGRLIYDRFKIRGGYLSEYFSLIFDEKDKFSGQGKCIEYCAEGTEDATIEWYGSRVNH